MKMRIPVSVMVAVALTGCVAADMDNGLDALMGQDIHAAIGRLGYPDGQWAILGDKVYYWGLSRRFSPPVSNISTTAGMAGGTPVYGTTTSSSWLPHISNCRIQITTDQNDIIKSSRWSGWIGSLSGCAPYAQALVQ